MRQAEREIEVAQMNYKRLFQMEVLYFVTSEEMDYV